MDYKTVFTTWYDNEFKETELYRSMCDTREESQWHREDSVGIHTDMVVAEYISRSPLIWNKYDLMGAVQCAIHDIGKPVCMRHETLEDGRVVKRFKGHELTSGMMWIDYITSHDASINQFLSDVDIYNIAVIAQYHLPYCIGERRAKWIKTHLETFGLSVIYARCVLSDGYGRISDNHEEKEKSMVEWLSDLFGSDIIHKANSGYPSEVVSKPFNTITECEESDVVLLVGCTGVGKSTFVSDKANVHSMDCVRTQLYGEDYTIAFNRSCEDKTFTNSVMKDYQEKRKNGKVYIDNTNLTIKLRGRYISGSHSTSAIVLLSSYDFNSRRLAGRKEVKTDEHDLYRMYYHNYSLPVYGELKSFNVNINFDYERS